MVVPTGERADVRLVISWEQSSHHMSHHRGHFDLQGQPQPRQLRSTSYLGPSCGDLVTSWLMESQLFPTIRTTNYHYHHHY